jgi:hypothetical protein
VEVGGPYATMVEELLTGGGGGARLDALLSRLTWKRTEQQEVLAVLT